jgi:hypothetical protein
MLLNKRVLLAVNALHAHLQSTKAELNANADVIEKLFRHRAQVRLQRSRSAGSRQKRQRKSWNEFQGKLSDRGFRRMFRMPRHCFTRLCRSIESNVGAEEFKSEEYLESLKKGHVGLNGSTRMNHAQTHGIGTGGFVSGEVKLALTLRFMAGGSYLDLSMLYEVGHTYAYEIFHHVLEKWICDDRLVSINGEEYLNDEEKLKGVAEGFVNNEDQCILGGIIGALDGWLVKIGKPNKRTDGVKNVGGYWSRKGYYAINVQVIVDRKKRILYRSILCRGAEHDSTAFKASSLYRILEEKASWLASKGWYLIGDSAYSIRSFLQVPYDNAQHDTPEDNFNFVHSSRRIFVECAFGEIDMRWGIFWKPLKFSLKHNCTIIDAGLRLHNFIVNDREEELLVGGGMSANEERNLFSSECIAYMTVNPTAVFGVFGGEGEERGDTPIGRPDQWKLAGKQLRDALRDRLHEANIRRPLANWFRSRANHMIIND